MRHLVGSLLVAMLTTSVIRADVIKTITSGAFSLGYGFTSDGWTTVETASANISPTGDFTFTPAPSGGRYTTDGVTFSNRVLGNGSTSYCANVDGFSVPIAASYTGAAPTDASTINPDYQLMLEITGIQMYVGGYATEHAQWEETTPGHSGTTSTLTDIAQWNTVRVTSAYTQLAWDPADYTVTKDLNDSFTRTFQIVPFTGADRYADGLEVFGRVSLSYNATPEPSTLALLTTGLVGLLAYAWRKR